MLQIIKHAGEGYTVALKDGRSVCSDSLTDYGMAGRWAERLHKAGIFASSTVAMIGGGLCVLPRVLGPVWSLTVYEIEPDLAEFCPANCTFIPGDWRETLGDHYACIIYDIGPLTAEDRAVLTAHLTPAGVLLELEN